MMKTWPELEFVLQEEESIRPPAEDSVRSQRADCTGWEDVVFEIADDDALD